MARFDSRVALPPELLATVFEFLSGSYDSRHRVEDLLGSPFGGMLNNIKKLSVKTANPTKGSNENLLEFLYSIPLDCLTAFDCEDYQANSDAFGILLRTQPHLSKLVVWLQDESPRGLPSVNLIGNSLQELRSLHFKLLKSSDKVLPGINSWLQNAPFVRDLIISAPHLGVLRTWTLPSKAIFPNLRDLTLSGLHLESPAHDTAVPLYLPRLEALKLCKCQNPGPLLQLIAKQNQASGNDCLRSFAYGNDLSKNVLPAVIDFLRSAKGLTKVVFQVDEAVQMPMLSSLGLHARTIRALELACGNFGPVCSLQDVEYIVANCTNLERLVLSLGTPVDVDDMKVLDPVQLSTSEEYSRTLETLAIVPSLKRLSLLGKMHEKYEQRQQQWRYAQVAEAVMAHLVKFGSNIEVLDLSSTFPNDKGDETDENGHVWPHYSYRKGSVVIDIGGRQQPVKIFAVPIPVERGGTRLW